MNEERDVPAADWVPAAEAARAAGVGWFDGLWALDEAGREPDVGFTVVCHLWSVAGRRGLLLRTTVPREAPRLATLTHLWPGAGWHEREAHEFLGIGFDGNADLAPLLLPDPPPRPPLRKDVELERRGAPWPGAHEPGGRRRAPLRAPGAPGGGT